MKIFQLIRKEDVSGVSGTGVVAEGVVFYNGKVVLCWKSDKSAQNHYESIDDVIKIHGHDGKTTYKILCEVFT